MPLPPDFHPKPQTFMNKAGAVIWIWTVGSSSKNAHVEVQEYVSFFPVITS